MKVLFITVVLASSLFSCANKDTPIQNKMVGTWELVYAETIENDSLEIKDLTNTRFIKIINNSHFSFFNQEKSSSKDFYGGAGTYTLNGSDYVETLHFTSTEALRNHRFPFKVEFKGDTLIQSGLEEVKAAGLKRNITEKYIKIN
jgi:hypothetical protein